MAISPDNESRAVSPQLKFAGDSCKWIEEKMMELAQERWSTVRETLSARPCMADL